MPELRLDQRLLVTPELAAKLAELPPLDSGDAAPYLVFADWLQSRGERWGELIVLQHEAETRPELRVDAEVWVRERGEDVLGPLARRPEVQVTWRYGFVWRVVLVSEPTVLAMFAAVDAIKPIAAFRKVREVCYQPLPAVLRPHADWEDSVDDIVDPWEAVPSLFTNLPSTVKRVGFGGWPAPAGAAYVTMPRFEDMAGVRELELTGAARRPPGLLSMPGLRVLEVRFAEVTTAALDALAAARLPELERLSVWLGGASHAVLDDIHPEPYPEEYPATDLERMNFGEADNMFDPAALVRLLTASWPPTLRELAFPSSQLNREICEAIVGSPLLRQIHHLDLSGGLLDDHGAEVLRANAAKLSKLRVLKLPRERMRVSTQEKLARALPNAEFDEPSPDRAAGRPEFYFRYVATME